MPFNVNFDEIPEWEVVPPGIYTVEVASAEERTSRNGNAMLNLRLQIVGGDDPQAEGQSVFANLMLEGRGLQITRQAFKALFGEAHSGKYDEADLVGRKCRVRITNRVYREEDGGDGSMRAQVSRWYPPTDADLF